MDYYTLTYRLDGQGSDTTTNFSTWSLLASFISTNKTNLLKAIISKTGNPTPPASFSMLFYDSTKIVEISFGNIDTSQVTNMSYMFGECKSLISLDVSGFNTSNVVNMSYMFSGFLPLTSLDLSNFNTKKVADMSGMFNSDNKLVTIFVSDLWNNSAVVNSSYMFNNCVALVGAVPYDGSKTDVSMANYTTGYFTKKSEPPIGPFIGEKYPLPPFKIG